MNEKGTNFCTFSPTEKEQKFVPFSFIHNPPYLYLLPKIISRKFEKKIILRPEGLKREEERNNYKFLVLDERVRNSRHRTGNKNMFHVPL